MARLSPDESQIAFYMGGDGLDIWVWNIAARTLKRIWPARAADLYPVWTHDGRIIFSSEREGIRNLFWGAADGTGPLSALVKRPNVLNASALTRDGSKLIYTEVSQATNEDVMEVDLTAPHRTRALLQSPSSERNGVVSPDGKWLAYEANSSDQFQVHVRAYPKTDGQDSQISTAGGMSPLWTRDGKGLIYATPQGLQGTLMRVDVTEGPTWKASAPYRAAPEGYAIHRRGGIPGRTYDTARDGRLLMLKVLPGDGPGSPPALVLVQNWSEGSRK
jgi:Tol biopolymer transport system component